MTRPTDIRGRFPQASASFLARNPQLSTTAKTTPVKSKTTTTEQHDPHDVTGSRHANANSSLSFFVAGNPVGQPRIRATVRKNCKHATVYDPGTADEWKALVAAAVQQYRPATQILGPVRLLLNFFLKRPKLHYGTDGSIKPLAPELHISKPDADNLAKAVMDAITATGLIWHDDCQVHRLTVQKLYSHGGNDKTGVHVLISCGRNELEVLP